MSGAALSRANRRATIQGAGEDVTGSSVHFIQSVDERLKELLWRPDLIAAIRHLRWEAYTIFRSLSSPEFV
ncbi:MAG: hypothetical protein ACK5AZ_12735 [Bryobacteraceae bacterium]